MIVVYSLIIVMNGTNGFTLPIPRGLTWDRVAFKWHAIRDL